MGYSKISDYKQIFMDTMAEFQIDLGYAVSIVSDNAANMCKFACEIDKEARSPLVEQHVPDRNDLNYFPWELLWDKQNDSWYTCNYAH